MALQRPSGSGEPGRSCIHSELVFGLVAAVGTDLSRIERGLADKLSTFG